MAALRTSRLRMIVGLIAAYAFVFQVLLTSVATAQMTAGADLSTLCYSLGGDGDHKPVGTLAHQTCIVCSVAPMVPAAPASGAVLAQRLGSDIQFHGVTERSAPVARVHSPRSSQGPPSVA